MFDYGPLWKTMSEKDISTYKLLKDYGFSKGTLDSLKQNRNVTMHTIDSLCQILEAPVEKIVHVSLDDFSERQRIYGENLRSEKKGSI